jgi:hypothetical protein
VNYITFERIIVYQIFGLPSLDFYAVANAPAKPIACKIDKSVISRQIKMLQSNTQPINFCGRRG